MDVVLCVLTQDLVDVVMTTTFEAVCAEQESCQGHRESSRESEGRRVVGQIILASIMIRENSSTPKDLSGESENKPSISLI